MNPARHIFRYNPPKCLEAAKVLRQLKRKNLTDADRERIIADAILAAYQAGVCHEQNQQWLRDTTGPRPRIKIVC